MVIGPVSRLVSRPLAGGWPTSSTVDKLRDCLANASKQVDQAIERVDELLGSELLECPVCGCMGCQSRSSTTTAGLHTFTNQDLPVTTSCHLQSPIRLSTDCYT